MDINYFFDIISGIIAFIMGFIPLIVIVFILTRLSKAAKTQQRSTGDPNVWLQRQQEQQAKQSQPRQVKSLKKGSSKSLFGQPVAAPKAEAGGTLAETFMKDDREHDWLARQMREEAKILRRGDMLDLGASHEASCDADVLKKYHLYLEHDDSVDSGEYKY
ncbi:MAG: hypothetical protein IKW92_10260 [Firmicutes bacterium]|nr:hypothetical protein [Bacillota bacterium]